MPNPVLHVRCWSCKDKFHMRIWKKDCNPGDNRVFKLIPCPYCQTDCLVSLKVEQAASTPVMRSLDSIDSQNPPLHEMPVDAFADQVFETIKPEKEGADQG